MHLDTPIKLAPGLRTAPEDVCRRLASLYATPASPAVTKSAASPDLSVITDHAGARLFAEALAASTDGQQQIRFEQRLRSATDGHLRAMFVTANGTAMKTLDEVREGVRTFLDTSENVAHAWSDPVVMAVIPLVDALCRKTEKFERTGTTAKAAGSFDERELAMAFAVMRVIYQRTFPLSGYNAMLVPEKLGMEEYQQRLGFSEPAKFHKSVLDVGAQALFPAPIVAGRALEVGITGQLCVAHNTGDGVAAHGHAAGGRSAQVVAFRKK